jgi:hypothetical protein
MKYFLLALVLVAAKGAYCLDGWWTIELNTFSLIDINGYNPNITLQPGDGADHQVGTGANAASAVNQIVITPPAGKEHDWLAVLMTAMTTGKNVRIYGGYSGKTISSIASNNHIMIVPPGL